MAGDTELLHDRNRLSIVSLLASSVVGSLSFKEIQEKTELTAGNLSSHLRDMEEIIRRYRNPEAEPGDANI